MAVGYLEFVTEVCLVVPDRVGRRPGGVEVAVGYLEFVTEVCRLCADFAHGLQLERVFAIVAVMVIHPPDPLPQVRHGGTPALTI